MGLIWSPLSPPHPPPFVRERIEACKVNWVKKPSKCRSNNINISVSIRRMTTTTATTTTTTTTSDRPSDQTNKRATKKDGRSSVTNEKIFWLCSVTLFTKFNYIIHIYFSFTCLLSISLFTVVYRWIFATCAKQRQQQQQHPYQQEEEGAKNLFTTSIQFFTAVAAVAVSSFLFCSLHARLLFIFLLIYMASVCHAARILRCHDIVEFY